MNVRGDRTQFVRPKHQIFQSESDSSSNFAVALGDKVQARSNVGGNNVWCQFVFFPQGHPNSLQPPRGFREDAGHIVSVLGHGLPDVYLVTHGLRLPNLSALIVDFQQEGAGGGAGAAELGDEGVSDMLGAVFGNGHDLLLGSEIERFVSLASIP